MAKKVYLGVGHGGKDPGAVANGFKEKDVALSIALACRDELVRHGVRVKMSRTKDADVPLPMRIKECNAFKPDFAADIHINAGGGNGGEVFHHYKGGQGKELAALILDEIVRIGQNSRGLKIKLNDSGRDYFGFIREISCPSVIVECAFLDNKEDLKIIDTPAKQKVMGTAIAKGMLRKLGIAYKPAVQVAQTASKPTVKSPKAGDAVTLNKGKLYISSTGKGYVTRTGKYYLYDGKKINGRYRVTNKTSRVGKTPLLLNVSGWVEL